MTNITPSLIYKITNTVIWTASGESKFVGPMPIDEEDGYMHFSTADQLRETLALYFKGQSDVVLLAVRTENIAKDLKWEPSRGGQLFPHLYKQLPVSEVAWSKTISVDDAGIADLPELK